MQTSTQSRQPAKAKRLPAIPYPDLPPLPSAAGTRREIFWRAAWLRDEAQVRALQEFSDSAAFGKARQAQGDRFAHAMAAALCRLQDEARQSLKTLIEAGGLLYAWLPEGGAA